MNGEGLGIRPMTKEEQEWLDKFNLEFGCANISYDNPGLHSDLLESNYPRIEEVRSQIKTLKKELKSIKYPKSGPPLKVDRQTDKKRDLVRKIHELESELLNLDPIKDIRKDNYNRSNDPLNYERSHINILDISPYNRRIKTKLSNSEYDVITYLEEKEFLKLD